MSASVPLAQPQVPLCAARRLAWTVAGDLSVLRVLLGNLHPHGSARWGRPLLSLGPRSSLLSALSPISFSFLLASDVCQSTCHMF